MKSIKRTYRKLESLHNDCMESLEVSRMERRLQMLIALILFTPTILSALGTESLQEDKTTLVWGIIVAVYISIYIYIEASKSVINKLKGHILNWGVWINLCAFVPFFVSTGLYQDVISGLPLVIFFIAMATIFWSPLLFIVVLTFEFMLGKLFSFVRTVR